MVERSRWLLGKGRSRSYLNRRWPEIDCPAQNIGWFDGEAQARQARDREALDSREGFCCGRDPRIDGAQARQANRRKARGELGEIIARSKNDAQGAGAQSSGAQAQHDISETYDEDDPRSRSHGRRHNWRWAELDAQAARSSN